MAQRLHLFCAVWGFPARWNTLGELGLNSFSSWAVFDIVSVKAESSWDTLRHGGDLHRYVAVQPYNMGLITQVNALICILVYGECVRLQTVLQYIIVQMITSHRYAHRFLEVKTHKIVVETIGGFFHLRRCSRNTSGVVSTCVTEVLFSITPAAA